jgi:hypothetical protein
MRKQLQAGGRWFAILGISLVLGGCVGSTAGQMTLSTDATRQGVYFVERNATDERDLAAQIAEKMRARGLNATSGTSGQQRPDCTYVVKYVDRWMWDMRMYLSDLRIELRDAKTFSIVGYGQSAQSSLKAMGQTHSEVIDAALNQLFGAH